MNGLKGLRVCLAGVRVEGFMETPPLWHVTISCINFTRFKFGRAFMVNIVEAHLAINNDSYIASILKTPILHLL